MAAKGSSTESPKVQPTSSGVAEPAPLNTQATDPKFAHLYDLNSDDNSEDVGPPSAKTGGNRKGKQRAESPETVGVGDGEVLPVGVGDEEVVLVEDYLDTDERPVSKERMTVDHVTEDDRTAILGLTNTVVRDENVQICIAHMGWDEVANFGTEVIARDNRDMTYAYRYEDGSMYFGDAYYKDEQPIVPKKTNVNKHGKDICSGILKNAAAFEASGMMFPPAARD